MAGTVNDLQAGKISDIGAKGGALARADTMRSTRAAPTRADSELHAELLLVCLLGSLLLLIYLVFGR